MLTPSMMQKVTNTSPNDTKSSAEALIHAEMREDTAIQRQVADLKAAGLNPVLAATGGYTGASSAAAVKHSQVIVIKKMQRQIEWAKYFQRLYLS